MDNIEFLSSFLKRDKDFKNIGTTLNEGIVLKNLSGYKEDIKKGIKAGIKKILAKNKKIEDLEMISGTPDGVDTFFDGYYIKLTKEEIDKVNKIGLDNLYNEICQNIEIKLDKNNYEDYEQFILDLPKGTTIEDFNKEFQKFIENASDEDKEHEDELMDYALDTFRNIMNLKEKYNVIVENKGEIEMEENILENKTNNIKQEKVNLEMVEFKQNILSNFEENYLKQYSDDMSKMYVRSDLDIQIKDLLDSDDYKKELDKEIDNRVQYEGSYLSKEDLKERYDIQIEELPPFKVFTTSGLAYTSDGGIYQYQDKDGNMIEPKAQEELSNLIGSKPINFDDIRSFEELANTGAIQLYYEEGKDLKEYTDYDDYIESTVNEKLKEEYLEKSEEVIKEIKRITEKEDYIKEENFEKLAEKYQNEVMRLENIIENRDEKELDEDELEVEEDKKQEKELNL